MLLEVLGAPLEGAVRIIACVCVCGREGDRGRGAAQGRLQALAPPREVGVGARREPGRRAEAAARGAADVVAATRTGHAVAAGTAARGVAAAGEDGAVAQPAHVVAAAGRAAHDVADA